ncbi:TPA: hypothetical protein JG906_000570 [Enterobacter hormaechei subsp. steigerwaltii]|nr:hypothetical protein [Enterobacter hormaechei]HAV1800295.1 hypothetical protein [Enterobacter hormaechei subsp. steigerwaltii]HCR0047240.1 hypothetical protein [Enterobacter hormaechei]HES7268695.1 hypothetical protein [Streptococcus pyogenes]
MIDPKLPLKEKKEALEGLLQRARQKVERASAIVSDNKSSLEQQILEGEREPDEKAYDDLKSALESLANAVEQLDTRSKELENDRQQQLIDLRETYANKAYKVAKYGLYWWAVVILLSAVGKCVGKDVISDQVLIAITTASTLNLFAAFLGVIRGLFPSGKEAKENGS